MASIAHHESPKSPQNPPAAIPRHFGPPEDAGYSNWPARPLTESLMGLRIWQAVFFALLAASTAFVAYMAWGRWSDRTPAEKCNDPGYNGPECVEIRAQPHR
jgi:hypothetical protein